jgi:hypothetical protein
MDRKVVDVFLGDRLIRSYAFDWDPATSPAFDQDFIDRARRRLLEDGYLATVISDARFIVKDEPGQA